MPEAPSHRRPKLAATAGLLGATAVVALILGVGPAPSMLQLAGASGDTADDVSGPCDEAEHAGDPECGGTAATRDDAATTSSTVDDDASPIGGGQADVIRSLDAAGAGTVVYAVEGGSVRLVTATPAPGWRVEVEQSSGPEIELDLRAGTQRVQVHVEIEDGQVRERVRVRDDAARTDVRTEDGVVRPDDSRQGSASHDAVDDDGPDDSSGPGSTGDDSVDDGSGHHAAVDDGSGHDSVDDSGSSGRDHPEDD